jgi:hypothetical protein
LDGCGAEGHCKDGSEPIRGVLITIDGLEYALYGSADNQGRETVLFDDYPQVYQRIRAKIRHVLWVSRHPLGDEQRASLQSSIEASYLSRFSPSKPVIIDVTETNITFPAHGADGLQMLCNLASTFDADTIAGVIPAHIAVKAAVVRAKQGLPFAGYLPVSAPAFAVHGEVRQYAHSHFEPF